MRPRKVDLSPRQEGLVRQAFFPTQVLTPHEFGIRVARAEEDVNKLMIGLPRGDLKSIQWDNRRRV